MIALKGKTIIAVFFTALMIFSGLLILENGAQSQGHNNQVPAVSKGPRLSTFTFNYTPRTGQYWDVDFNGQVQVSSGSHITFTAPAGNYTYEIMTPQGYFSGHALVKLSGAPWWYTVGSSALAGASLGFIVGGPIGALVGGIAGAIVGAIFASWYNNPGAQTGTTQAIQLAAESETNNTFQAAWNQLTEAISMITTTSSLMNTSYYYFAQEMEAVAERYMNASFTESQLILSSGVLQQIAMIMQPLLDTIGYTYADLYNWALSSEAGPSNQIQSALGDSITPAAGLSGEPLTVNDYYMLNGNNSFFYIQNLTMTWENVFSGKECTFTTPTMSTVTTYEYLSSGTSITYPLAGTFKTKNMTGLYQLISLSGGDSEPSFTDGLYLGSSYTTLTALPLSLVLKNEEVQAGFSINRLSNAGQAGVIDTLNAGNNNSVYRNGYVWAADGDNQICYNYSKPALNSIFTVSNQAFDNAYTSAQVFIQKLEMLGIFNYSQIPANETIPFPSWFVPASMLNGTFNESELYALYIAYLDSLNNTFHHEKTLTGNDSINQTIFSGFAQESGILNLSNNYSGHKEINGTFLIEINQGKLDFHVGQETTFTSQTPVIVINGYYGDPTYLNGSLIQASANSTFYTTAILVNGTSEQSYTLSAQLIKVFITSPGNLTAFPTGAFFLNNKTVEYLIIAVLVIVILAAVIVGMGRKGHKDKKKRTN